MFKIILGIIIGFVAAIFFINKDILKLAKLPTPAATESSFVLSTAEAEELVKNQWADIVIPKCGEEEEICPHLAVSVVNTKDIQTKEDKTSMIFADVVGFADDSYAGERRQASVSKYNGKWALGTPSEFTLCRAMQPYPKGAKCP